MAIVKQASTPEELQAILNLRYKLLRQPWNKPIDTASDELESQSVNAYITNDSGTIIACGRLHENENRIGQIRFMAVEEGHQGKGLGKLIVDYLEEKARAMELHKIQLQARENAVAFYKSCGYFTKEKSFLLWDTIQHYLMEKKL
jgi:N-acetylglutamate synthase-like GNAT family acetyltransferase